MTKCITKRQRNRNPKSDRFSHLLKVLSSKTLMKKFDSHSLIDSLIQSCSISRTLICLVDRVFANGLGELGSIPGSVLPKTLKMVLDTSLLNTRQYKVRIEGEMEQSRERSGALPDTSV